METKLRRYYILIALSCLCLTLNLTATTYAADWPNWRGPNHNGISSESGFIPKFQSNKPNFAFRIDIGTGFSSISVANQKAYTMGNENDTDIIYCIDANSGKIIWTHKYPEPLTAKMYEGGPNATPSVNEQKVYTISKTGNVFCLDASDGNIIWNRNLKLQPDVEIPTWGLAGSPVIVDDMVILNAGSLGIALNKSTGSTIWKTGDGKAGYASAVPYKKDNKTHLAMFGADAIAGLNAQTGNVIWQYKWKTSYGVNAADPIVHHTKVFISSGYGKGCALLDITDSKPNLLWENKNMRNHFNSSVLYEGYIYGFDEKTLTCLDFKTGQKVWTQGGLGKGSLMLADGKLIILSENGKLVFAKADHQKFTPIDDAKILGGRCWTVPVLANGKVYARNAEGNFACVILPVKDSTKSSVSKTNNKIKNWWQFRGPDRNGKSTETGLMKTWPEKGPNMIWSTEGIGKGYSSMAIVDGIIYTAGMVEKTGFLSAYSTDGKLKWKSQYGDEWTRSFPGSRATPTIVNDKIFFATGLGKVLCFNKEDGKIIWSLDAYEKFDGDYGPWGYPESILYHQDKVFYTPGGKGTSVIAMNAESGKIEWKLDGLDERHGYGTPVMIKHQGKNIFVNMLKESLILVDADTGKLLDRQYYKSYSSANRNHINPNLPLYNENQLFTTSGYDHGSAMYQLNSSANLKLLWNQSEFDTHHGNAVNVNGYIYGSNWIGNQDGKWLCIKWNDGKIMYQHHWFAKGSIIYADQMLYCYEEENGTVALVKASPDGFDIKGKFTVKLGQDEHWAHPAIWNKTLFIRHGDAMMAYDIKQK